MKVSTLLLYLFFLATWYPIATEDDKTTSTTEQVETTTVTTNKIEKTSTTLKKHKTPKTTTALVIKTTTEATTRKPKKSKLQKTVDDDDEKYKNWISQTWELYPRVPNAAPFSSDPTCRSDSRKYIDALQNKSMWAVRMWDATPKSADGVVYGSMIQTGSYDGCLHVTTPIRSQYCISLYMSQISPNISDKENVLSYMRDYGKDTWNIPRDVMKWGLCAPASCNSSEMATAINSYLQNISTNDNKYMYVVAPNSCTVAGESPPLKAPEIALWVYCGAIFLFCLICSFFVMGNNLEDDTGCRGFLRCFSIPRNFGKLTKFDDKLTRNPLTGFHGLKVMSIFVVYFSHKMMASGHWLIAHGYTIEVGKARPEHAFMLQGDLVCDNFFFISGVLITVSLLKAFKKRFVNPITLIIIRILRLAPSYYFVLWFHTYGLERTGDGPLWRLMLERDANFCKENWWTNMLFINNYYKVDGMCLPHSWYVNCDLHFYIIAIFVLTIMYKFEKLGVFLISILLGLSTVAPGLTTYFYELEPLYLHENTFITNPRTNKPFAILYITSHNRAAIFFIGMLSGYIIFKLRKSKKTIGAVWIIVGIVVAIACMIGPMFFGSYFFQRDSSAYRHHRLYSAIFSAIRRPLWGIGITIFFLIYRFRPMYILYTILESNAAIFVSRITYGIYLAHFTILLGRACHLRAAKAYFNLDVFMEGTSEILLTGLFAIAIHVFVDSPIQNILQKTFFRQREQSLKLPPVIVEPPSNGNSIEIQDKY